MDLESLDIKGIITSMPDPSHLIMRLAPQEVDMLASVLYGALQQGAEKAVQQNLKDPEAVHKIYYNSITDQLSSIENELSIKNLAGKIDMSFILEKL